MTTNQFIHNINLLVTTIFTIQDTKTMAPSTKNNNVRVYIVDEKRVKLVDSDSEVIMTEEGRDTILLHDNNGVLMQRYLDEEDVKLTVTRSWLTPRDATLKMVINYKGEWVTIHAKYTEGLLVRANFCCNNGKITHINLTQYPSMDKLETKDYMMFTSCMSDRFSVDMKTLQLSNAL